MNLYRCGKTNIRKNGSGWEYIGEQALTDTTWTESFEVESTIATSDDAKKHTMIKMSFSETDIVSAYNALMAGRANALYGYRLKAERLEGEVEQLQQEIVILKDSFPVTGDLDIKPVLDTVNWETGKVEGACQYCGSAEITGEKTNPLEIKISCPKCAITIGTATRKEE